MDGAARFWPRSDGGNVYPMYSGERGQYYDCRGVRRAGNWRRRVSFCVGLSAMILSTRRRFFRLAACGLLVPAAPSLILPSQSRPGADSNYNISISGGGGSTTTLDPATLAANQSLSNGNLTNTATSSANAITRSIASHATGKYYFEFTPAASGSIAGIAVGIGTASMINTDYLTQIPDSVGVGYGGTTWNGSGLTGTTTCPALVAAHVFGIAVDFGATLIWVLDITGGTGQWNANATANPATGVNGCNFSAAVSSGSGNFEAAVTCSVNTNSVTFNFGGSAYSGSVPSGFGNM